MSNAIENLKRMYSAQAIEAKDISLQDLVNKEGKDGSIVIRINGIASKFVKKYASENNYGYHTMLYMIDGRKTGAFSNALYDFARFLYAGAKLNTDAEFNKIEFPEDGFLEIKVTVIKLDSKKSTYNFEIVDGLVDKVARIGGVDEKQMFLLEDK